jgi:ActR/RegA family two-component response regulator
MQEQDASLLVIEDGDLGRLIAIELATVGLAVDVALNTAAARDCMRRRAYAAVLVDLRLCDVRRPYRPVAPAAGPTLHVIAPASLQKVETDGQATTSPGIIAAFETLLAPACWRPARANLGP